MTKAVRVFLNARSGSSGVEVGEKVAALFAELGVECDVTKLEEGLDLKGLATSEPGDVVFVAAGGDGTVNAVSQALAGTGRTMGVLPVGTLNHFAKDLGLPLQLEDAVRAIAEAQVREVDAAEVNGEIFVNNSSLGVYPTMVREREYMKKTGLNKWASLVLASAKAFARFKCLTVDLEVDGKARRCTTPFVFVGNNEYCLEGMALGERKRVDAGFLSVYIAPGATRATMLRLLFAAMLGRVKDAPEFEEFKVRQFSVEVRRKRHLRVSLDGEVTRMQGPLHYVIQPRALRVICGWTENL